MFGDILRVQRLRRGLTQEELAGRANIGVRTIRDLESGKAAVPRPATVRLLADAFGLRAAEREQFQDAVRLRSREEPEPAAVPRRSAPAQLPSDAAGFTGRVADLRRLDDLLAADEPAPDGPPGAVRLVIITGTPGVGKTALAVRWAHTLRHRFRSEQLYVNLRGFDPSWSPLQPIDALGRFLRALGVPAHEVPVDVDEAAALYRSLLADQRFLVLLDNAASVEQVRPLIPAGSGCLVLVTSRNQLPGLVVRDGAKRHVLYPLGSHEAVGVLSAVLGVDRVAAEPGAAEAVAAACAYLPLTLRIAAANLAENPGRPIGSYLTVLSVRDRLDELAIHGDQQCAARAAFDLSYRKLEPDAQRLFRLLGLTPSSDWTADSAGALLGVRTSDAERLIRRLEMAHLVQQHMPGRYTFHDLLRLYARQQAERGRTTTAGRPRSTGSAANTCAPPTWPRARSIRSCSACPSPPAHRLRTDPGSAATRRH